MYENVGSVGVHYLQLVECRPNEDTCWLFIMHDLKLKVHVNATR